MSSKSPTPPPIQAKHFSSVEEIDMGLKKLQRRMKDLEALKGVRHDSQEVDNAQQAIRCDILDIFGENSSQGRANKHHRIWRGGMRWNMSEQEKQVQFDGGIEDTELLLKSLVKNLEEEKEDFRPHVSVPLPARQHSSTDIPITVQIINNNEFSISMRSSITQIITQVEDDTSHSVAEKNSAKKHLQELDEELKKENPSWEVFKKILAWALDFSQKIFLQILPIILKHYSK